MKTFKQFLIEADGAAKDAWKALLRVLVSEEDEADLSTMYDGDDEELKKKLAAKVEKSYEKNPMYKKSVNDPKAIALMQELIDAGIIINASNAEHWAEDIMGGFGTTHRGYKPPKGSDHKAVKKLTNYIYKLSGMDDELMHKIDD